MGFLKDIYKYITINKPKKKKAEAKNMFNTEERVYAFILQQSVNFCLYSIMPQQWTVFKKKIMYEDLPKIVAIAIIILSC